MQPLGHPIEGGHVGGVARPHLAAHRNAVAVDDHPQHHLLAIAAVVLALAILAQRLAAIAGEEQRGGVEEHQVEVGEEIAAPREQRLLDEVFGAPRRGGVGLGFTECLAEPAHRAVQMLEFKRFGAVDGLVTAPGAAVGARDHEAVQHGDEHCAFDIEVMVAGGEQLAHDRPGSRSHATGVRRSVPGRSRRRWRRANRVHRWECSARTMRRSAKRAAERRSWSMAPEAVSLSSRPSVAMMGLFDAFAFAAILRDLKILIGADLLDADEHVASP